MGHTAGPPRSQTSGAVLSLPSKSAGATGMSVRPGHVCWHRGASAFKGEPGGAAPYGTQQENQTGNSRVSFLSFLYLSFFLFQVWGWTYSSPWWREVCGHSRTNDCYVISCLCICQYVMEIFKCPLRTSFYLLPITYTCSLSFQTRVQSFQPTSARLLPHPGAGRWAVWGRRGRRGGESQETDDAALAVALGVEGDLAEPVAVCSTLGYKAWSVTCLRHRAWSRPVQGGPFSAH